MKEKAEDIVGRKERDSAGGFAHINIAQMRNRGALLPTLLPPVCVCTGTVVWEEK